MDVEWHLPALPSFDRSTQLRCASRIGRSNTFLSRSGRTGVLSGSTSPGVSVRRAGPSTGNEALAEATDRRNTATDRAQECGDAAEAREKQADTLAERLRAWAGQHAEARRKAIGDDRPTAAQGPHHPGEHRAMTDPDGPAQA